MGKVSRGREGPAPARPAIIRSRSSPITPWLTRATPGSDDRADMNRLAWLTDLHLNFVTPGRVDRLCRAVRDAGADAVLLGGDIGEAPDVVGHLEGLDARLGLPLYFVLGNHDFYRGPSPASAPRSAALCAAARLHWLPDAGVVALTPRPAWSATTAGPTGGSATTTSPRCCSTTTG